MPEPAGHPSSRLNRVLDDADFDTFVEAQCTKFYAEGLGRPSVTPGRYFRLLLLGYFEGLDSERAIADDETATQTFGLGTGHLTPHPEGTCAQEAMVHVRGNGRPIGEAPELPIPLQQVLTRDPVRELMVAASRGLQLEAVVDEVGCGKSWLGVARTRPVKARQANPGETATGFSSMRARQPTRFIVGDTSQSRQQSFVKVVTRRNDVVALLGGDTQAKCRHNRATERRVKRVPSSLANALGS